MTIAFAQGAKVRFTQERLSILTPRDRQSLAGRIGVIQTNSTLVSKPTVHFPADGARVEVRLFRVDPRQLELVEAPPVSAIKPFPMVAADQSVHEPAAVNDSTAEGDGGGKLSQDDLDKMFD